MAASLTGVLLGITGVLFITLPISRTNDSTLGESIFGKKENPEVVNVELLVKVTGENTMGHVQNSKTPSRSLVRKILVEPYSPSTGHLEGSTTKRPDSFFFTTF
ncbi:sodium:alanine symporter [Synechococcus phage S-BM3]|nr:sodium:alanine symporter [Synechococcus phage S-BM3]